MSDAAHREPKKSNKTKTLLSMVALSAVTLIAAVVMISEARVKADCDNTYQAIGAAISKKNVSREEVKKKFIHGSPVLRFDKENRRELFTWDGTLGSYALELEYDLYGDVKRIQPR